MQADTLTVAATLELLISAVEPKRLKTVAGMKEKMQVKYVLLFCKKIQKFTDELKEEVKSVRYCYGWKKQQEETYDNAICASSDSNAYLHDTLTTSVLSDPALAKLNPLLMKLVLEYRQLALRYDRILNDVDILNLPGMGELMGQDMDWDLDTPNTLN